MQPLSFEAPEARYVYEHVYGIIGSEYAVASNGQSLARGTEGVLLSASEGVVFPEGITVSPDAVGPATEGQSVIPFKQNGEYGLIEFATKRIVVQPQYDFADAIPGGRDGDRWGFVDLGARAGDGTYPSAKAVIRSIEEELFSVNLPDYGRNGQIYYYSDEDCWIAGWYSRSNSSVWQTVRISEDAGGFKVIESDLDGVSTRRLCSSTPDGHKVQFQQRGSDSVSFLVTNPDGTMEPAKTLSTDQASINSFRTVSNLIEVRYSNGYGYQYFNLDGTLLQNMNDQCFQELGNYVTYVRPAFDTQERTQTFLSTVDENSQPIEIPALASYFPSDGVDDSLHPSYFECIGPGNKIQRYDTNLNVVLEFDAAVDMEALADQGADYLNWSLFEPFEGAWLIEETAGYRGNGGRIDVADASVRMIKDGHTFDQQALGLASAELAAKGLHRGYLYLMDKSKPCKIRFYADDISLYKETDLSSVVSDGTAVSRVEFHGPSGSISNSSSSRFSQIVLNQNSFDSVYRVLDENLDLTEFARLECDANDVPYAASQRAFGGPWAFVDDGLNLRSDFIYSYIWHWPAGSFYAASLDDEYRIFDADMNDVFGFALDAFSSIGDGVYCIEHHGDQHVFTGRIGGNLKEISLHGYKLFERQSSGWIPSPDRRTTRMLPDGSIMLYVKDAQGRVGAMNDAGQVVIPVQFQDFAEDTGVDQDSDYIMLKDADGWFFVPVSDLQASVPNEDCALLGHDYEDAVYPATCTTNGYVQHVCNRCGYAFRDEASGEAALGHDFLLTSEAVAPTCTEDGHEDEYTCSRCGEKQGGRPLSSLGGHSWNRDDVRFITYPTCTEVGLYEYSCTRCGEVVQEVSRAYGHRWSGPVWTWSSDFQSACARYTCSRCGDHDDVDAVVTHEEVADGMRHSAVIKRYGIDVKDGRLALGWTDENGVARSLLVKGAPVADGFYAWPQGLSIPEDKGGTVEIDVVPVTYGGVFDALVSKIGDGWPAGTFDVRLNIEGSELHEGFGTLAFAFPAGPASAGKKAVVHHCHKDDRNNITSHEAFVTSDGMIVLDGIVDLSTFALEVLEDESPIAGAGGTKVEERPSKGQAPVTALAQTGDENLGPLAFGFIVTELALSFGIAALLVWRKRKTASGDRS